MKNKVLELIAENIITGAASNNKDYVNKFIDVFTKMGYKAKQALVYCTNSIYSTDGELITTPNPDYNGYITAVDLDTHGEPGLQVATEDGILLDVYIKNIFNVSFENETVYFNYFIESVWDYPGLTELEPDECYGSFQMDFDDSPLDPTTLEYRN